MALGPFVPYLATATAGTCNVSFTRMDEIQNGVVVRPSAQKVLYSDNYVFQDFCVPKDMTD